MLAVHLASPAMLQLNIILKKYCLPFFIFGLLYGISEYLVSLNTTTPESLLPLFARVYSVALPLGISIGLFEITFKNHFAKRSFLYLVFLKAFSYTLIISFWLVMVNGVWQVISSHRDLWEGIIFYMRDPMYFINLISIFAIVLIYSSLEQINSLHRKGELIDFIIGRYHQPKEVERIFAFIDLKGSTTIAEHLGHKKFGLFLKDYYADLTEPIRSTKAEIYQYVGDQIILSWPPKVGFTNHNAIHCILEIQKTIEGKKSLYTDRYGYFPEFRTGMHSGTVLVTWVGEIKKEILYIGDVMNTTARIQEECKRLGQEFLISDEIAGRLDSIVGVIINFQEETTPRGKEKPVRLYSVAQNDSLV